MYFIQCSFNLAAYVNLFVGVFLRVFVSYLIFCVLLIVNQSSDGDGVLKCVQFSTLRLSAV